MSDPFASRRREAFQSDRFPDWTVDAACRKKVTQVGEAWEAAFQDDLTYKPQGEYNWPASIVDVMKVCSGCPVRRKCLDYSFDLEQPVLLGTRIANDDEYERWGKPYIEEWLTPEHVGVYGGVPGPMRQRFSPDPNKRDLANEWFLTFTQERRWAPPKTTEEVA